MKKSRQTKRSSPARSAPGHDLPKIIADVLDAMERTTDRKLPPDLSERYKYYLGKWSYGRKRPR
jgi:hypothetical protein